MHAKYPDVVITQCLYQSTNYISPQNVQILCVNQK